MPEGWQPLDALVSSPGALSAAIGQVRAKLAAAAGRPADSIEFRVAASVTQLGLCARLLSPVIAAAALGGGLRVELGQVWWRPPPGGPFGLSVPRTAVSADGGRGLRNCLDVLAGPVSALVGSTESMSVSAQVLWGNVASAVNGATAMIAAARPELAPAASAAAGAMLDFPALAGSYRGSPATAGFRRVSCCLIYRLAPPEEASYCGDCVLGPDA